jgi:CxxC-x17-CxxC domain-containing protein
MFQRKYESSGNSAARKSGSGRGSYNSGPREMTDVTCSECGKQTQVPFKPDGSRPVYCSDCYQKHKPARTSRRY